MFLKTPTICSTYKAEIEEYRGKLIALDAENTTLRAELERTKELLQSALSAKENDCLRGEYCGYCKHGVMVERIPCSGERSKCVCTYGTCQHFSRRAAE